MERIMAVVTCEKKYAERLCEFVNRNNNLIFTAVPFTELKDCIEFGKKHNIELLLADSDLVGFGEASEMFRKSELRGVKLLRLVDGLAFGRALADNDNVSDMVNKYQPADLLIREVMKNCEGTEFRHSTDTIGRPVRIIGVYSPIGRCGKTSFALALSRMMGKNKKVLYLSLEEFSFLSSMCGEDYTVSLSDALYHLKQGNLNAQKIFSMIYTFSGIDYIPPIRYAEDRYAVSGDDFIQLINVILLNTLYEVVVVDMNRFSAEASEILEICSTIYMPILTDPVDRAKKESFLEELKASGREALAERITEIKTPEPIAVKHTASYVETLCYGPMGDLIHELHEA